MMEIDMAHDIGAIIEALEQYTRGDDHQRAIDAAVEVLRAVESRESALIADYQRLMDKHNALHVNAQAVRVGRDALLIAGGDLANCAYNLAQRSGEVLSARSAVALDNARRKWDAALSAPAVEGGCDGHKKIRDSATTLDAELASLNAMRYNRTL